MTTCPLCDKTVTYAGLGKHFCSRDHLELWVKPRLLKEKDCLNSWRNSTKLSSCPFITIKGKSTFMCFGCKKVKQFLPGYHLTECPEAEKHIATLKQMLATVDPSDVNPGEELIKFKKKYAMLEKQQELLEGFEIKFDSLEYLFKELADTLNDEDRATWLEKLEEIKND